ncbi:SemiSWEET transporter [Pontibacter sp. G13]|uniref:SemiSWEET transporter n=1 Tax=Pontibacter sp. G13 TaxID=3074898 RepID=UPI00288AE823|nr:SemiSWEET transporter [Pontibacter sp. G13]WNJ20791.1 SemiSWEET transporter [Pontibacter sp. G13]
MDWIQVMGIVAGICTTAAFLPQVIKTWKTKSAEDLSLGMFLLFVIGILLWLSYGIILEDIPLILANSLTLILASTLLYFKIRY